MDNINNNINKFDGKYLKCIVSKYKAVTNYLANSGSMIILQPGGTAVNRNYMYLGNEFIASGYGLSTEEKQITAERIVNEYDKTIEELQIADKNEATIRKQTDDAIVNNFNNYVAINKGPIDETIFRLNNYNIPTKDIVLYGHEAHYDNLEVKHIEIFVHGTYFNHNQEGVNVSSNYKNNIILCPIGSRIIGVDVNIETEDNDSGGLEKLVVWHNKEITEWADDDNIEGVMIKYDYDYDYNYTLNDENGLNFTTHKWYYTKLLNNNYVLREYLQDAIKNIYMYVKATPVTAYKYYPGLLEKGFKIFSSESAIKENKIDLKKSLDIQPQYYIRYSVNEPFNSNNFYNTNINSLPLNNFSIYDKTDLTFNINIDNRINNEIYIAIPNKFKLHKIYLIDDHNQKYNWTGALNVKENVWLPCAYSEQNSDGSWPCIEHNIYSLTCDTQFTSDIYEINIITIYYNNEAKATDVIDMRQNEITGDGTSYNIINDEEFNNLYWVPGNKPTALRTILDAVNENGIQH